MRIDQSNVYRLNRPRGRAAGSQPDVVIVCRCGATDTIRSKGNTPTEVVGQRFRQRGWQVDAPGKKALCRDCQMKKTAKAAAPTTAALKSQILAVRLLDEHFDIDSGRYADAWSDATIAKEVGLAEDAIASMRELAYGPLAVDPEVSRIQAELDAANKRWATERKELEDLIKNLDAEIGKVMAGLRCRLLEATKGRLAPNGAA